jgi:hypothetical protein
MKGNISQAKSRTAIVGYLAAVASGLSGDQPQAAKWLESKGVTLGLSGLRGALSSRLTRLGKKPDGEPLEVGWIREGLDFDATKLDLDLALVVFPPSDHPDKLIEVLRLTERMVRLYRGYEGGLVAILAFDGAREHRWLRTLLEEREPELAWILVREVDDSSAASAWLSLAFRCAEQESLATSK